VVVLTFKLGRIPPVGSMLGLLATNPPNLASASANVFSSLAIAIMLVVGVTVAVPKWPNDAAETSPPCSRPPTIR
jgi:hypothetical protein